MDSQQAIGQKSYDSAEMAAGWGILRIRTWKLGDGTLSVRLEGDLDIYSAGDLHNQLREAEVGTTDVVIDLSGLVFIDCAGLHQVVEADKRARQRGGRLMLVKGPPAVTRVFTLTGLESAFEYSALLAGKASGQKQGSGRAPVSAHDF